MKGHFSVLYFNARSILPKIDFLRVLCSMYKPDCICIVESWLSSDILDSELCIHGYDIIRRDRSRHGGGVLLFINSVFTHNLVFTGSPELELAIVTVRLLSASLNNSPFYGPPDFHTDNLLTALRTHIINPPLLSDFIPLRDFNVKYLDTSHSLSSCICSHSFTTHSSSLVDLVFLSQDLKT